MNREKMIQELIQKRIDSNDQIRKDNKYIHTYREKKERLNELKKWKLKPLMEEVEALSMKVEKQKEAKTEAELKAYEAVLEKLSIEKEKYESIKAEQEAKFDAFKESMEQQRDILLNRYMDYDGDRKESKSLEKEYDKFYKSSDKQIDKLREKIDDKIYKAEEHYEKVKAKAELKKPLVIQYEEKLKELETAKAEVHKLERDIEACKNAYDTKLNNIAHLKSEIKEQTYKEFEVYKNYFAFYCVIKNNFLAPIIKSIYNKK